MKKSKKYFSEAYHLSERPENPILDVRLLHFSLSLCIHAINFPHTLGGRQMHQAKYGRCHK